MPNKRVCSLLARLLALLCLFTLSTHGQAQTGGIAAQQTSSTPLQLRITDGDLTSVLGNYTFKSTNVLLVANATNYVYLDLSTTPPTLTVNQTGFPAGKSIYQIATAVTGAAQITSLADSRPTTFNSTLAGSSSSSLSPSSAYTFSVAAGTVTATPNATGLSTFSGSDACVVFNQVTAALATVGGKLFFKNGIYNCNSLTNDATTGCSNFDSSGKQLSYGFVFPANTVATSVQWLLEGESMPLWQGEALTATVNNAGVIFKITSAAVSSVTANNVLAGFWQKASTNCTLSATNSSNEVHFKNMALRFPVNTRGNEIAFAPYFSEAVEYENVTSDFDVAYNTLATGAAPTKGSYGSFGLATTVSSASNYQYFRNAFSSGYDIAYDFQSEHVIGETLTAIYSNFACEFGRSGTAVFHPNWIVHFVDQENGAGCIWGPQMIQASAVDAYFDFEFGNDANWYSTARAKTAKLTETNCNIGTGIIRYGVVVANQGSVAEVPGANLFTSCGQNFTFQEVAQPLNYAQAPALDTFTRPNSSGLGPAWAVIATGAVCNMAIASNAATSGVGSLCAWVSQPANADQFAKATINTIDATGMAVIIRSSLSANTYNDYVCTSTTGQLLRKRVAGTFTTIATNATNCAVADVMELRAVGTNYFAYRNGVQSMTATDASVTSGFPGIAVGAVTDSVTNWSGGSLPLYDQTRSQASQPFFASTYFTQTNCSNSGGTCASASSGAVSIAAAATTVTVATTAVNLNSDIQVQRNDALGTRLSVTCNTATAAGDIKVTTITAGVSFVITVQNAPAANPLCLTYSITN